MAVAFEAVPDLVLVGLAYFEAYAEDETDQEAYLGSSYVADGLAELPVLGVEAFHPYWVLDLEVHFAVEEPVEFFAGSRIDSVPVSLDKSQPELVRAVLFLPDAPLLRAYYFLNPEKLHRNPLIDH